MAGCNPGREKQMLPTGGAGQLLLLCTDKQICIKADRQADRPHGSRCWHVSVQKGKSETLTVYGNTVHLNTGTPVQWDGG